jgi:RNA polymerase sigma factor (sigma-70 family)
MPETLCRKAGLGGRLAISFDSTLEEYLKEIDESPLLNSEEEYELARRIIELNDPQAREHLVRSNLRLVVNIAKKYGNRGMHLSDLIEEGNLGLLRAIDSFDTSFEVRFSTYAAWWIKQSIKRALQISTQPIHVPGYMVELIHQWRQTCAELETQIGYTPTIEQAAKKMKLSLRKAKVIAELIQNISSGVRNDTLDENQGLEDTLEDERAEAWHEAILNEEEIKKAVAFLDELEPREAQVLILRFGLDGHPALTLKQIGKKLGLTRERARQIQHLALAKLNELMTV